MFVEALVLGSVITVMELVHRAGKQTTTPPDMEDARGALDVYGIDEILSDHFRQLYGEDAVELPEIVPVFFKDGEPRTFAEYMGQESVIRYLEYALRGLTGEERAIEPQLLLGQAGFGKTLLSKVIANELAQRAERLGQPPLPFIEVFPVDIENVDALDEIMRRVVASDGAVMLIDEIHTLTKALCMKLYLVLEEGRYKFKEDQVPVMLPNLTLLGATTDYGQLHAAMKRRWHKHFLKPATPEQLVGYVRARPFPISESVARLIVERTKFSGAPWEPLELYRTAVTMAKGRGASMIEVEDVQATFELEEIDEYGLRWLDREVMKAMLAMPKYRGHGSKREFMCYAGSEANVCLMAGTDADEYRNTIRPRLMARQLLEIRPYYGQSLTDKALCLYGNLRNEEL